jgi:hypothetical protein
VSRLQLKISQNRKKQKDLTWSRKGQLIEGNTEKSEGCWNYLMMIHSHHDKNDSLAKKNPLIMKYYSLHKEAEYWQRYSDIKTN